MPVLHCLCIGLIATECRGEVLVYVHILVMSKTDVDVPIGILFERVLYCVNRNITSLDNAKCSAYM